MELQEIHHTFWICWLTTFLDSGILVLGDVRLFGLEMWRCLRFSHSCEEYGPCSGSPNRVLPLPLETRVVDVPKPPRGCWLVKVVMMIASWVGGDRSKSLTS